MKNMIFRFVTLALGVVVLLISAGCREKEASTGPSSDTKPVVYVPVPPYEKMVSRIAGDLFEVRSLVSESDDPHDFSPTPKQVAQLSKASFLFTGEMPFEETLVEKLTDGNSKIRIFSLTDQIDLLEGSCEHDHGDDDGVFTYVKGQDSGHDHDHDHGEHEHADKHDHDHGEHDHDHADHDHHHHELDPHVWLSPKMLKIQAVTIAGVLKNASSTADAATIDGNLKAVLSELESLDNELAEKLAFMKGKTFYVYHGAFAYFAKAYGMEQVAIELGGRRPEPKRLAQLAAQAKEAGVKLIFVQPQFDQTSAKSLAESIGGKVLPLDPLESDVFANLRKIADTI